MSFIPSVHSVATGLARDGAGLMRRRTPRRLAYAGAALLMGALTLYPRHYEARAKLLPQQGDNGGLSAVLGALGGGGLQNFASLLQTHQTIEVYLMIGRSHDVHVDVLHRLGWGGPPGSPAEARAEVKLIHAVDVHSLTGGVLEIQGIGPNPASTQKIVSAYVDAVQDRVTELAHNQLVLKRKVVNDKVAAATRKLSEAEAALNAFRSANKLASPEAQLGAEVALKASLEGQLRAKQVQLETVRQFATGDNTELRALQSEVAGLQQQVARTETASATGGAPTLAGMSAKTSEYINLFRDFKFAETLYEVYTRSLEQVNVEELTNSTNSGLQVIEAPFVEPGRQFNVPGLAGMTLVALLAFFTEFYVPATRLGFSRPARGGQAGGAERDLESPDLGGARVAAQQLQEAAAKLRFMPTRERP